PRTRSTARPRSLCRRLSRRGSSGGPGAIGSACLRTWRRHVFEDAAEVAEADRGVDALRHFRGLETGGLTSARESVVDVEGGEGGCQSAPTGALEGSGVVDR